MRIIKHNRIRCKKCGDIIESESRHDFKTCSCGSCSVDGGKSYLRRSGDFENIEELSEYEEVPGYEITVYYHYGYHNSFMIPNTVDINEIISNYEDMWHYVIVEDEDGNEIYRSKGVENMLT